MLKQEIQTLKARRDPQPATIHDLENVSIIDYSLVSIFNQINLTLRKDLNVSDAVKCLEYIWTKMSFWIHLKFVTPKNRMNVSIR